MSGAYDHFKTHLDDTHIKVTNSIEGDIGVMMNRANDLFMRKFDGKIYRPNSEVAIPFADGFIKNLNDGSYVLTESRASVSSRWVVKIDNDYILIHSKDNPQTKLVEVQQHYPQAELADIATKGTVKAGVVVLVGHKCIYDINDEIVDYEPFNDEFGVFTKGADFLPEATNYTKYFNQVHLRGKVRASVATNALLAPDGSMTATKCTDTTDNNDHSASSNHQYVAKDTHMVFSHYVKAGELPSCILDIFSDAAAVVQQRYYRVAFNLIDGTVMNTRASGEPEDTMHGIEDAGGGWYRCWVSLKHYGSRDEDRIDAKVYLFNNTTIIDGHMLNPTYTGNGTDSLYAWGAQLEEGQVPTLPLITGNGAFTRLDDGNNLVQPTGDCTVAVSDLTQTKIYVKSGASEFYYVDGVATTPVVTGQTLLDEIAPRKEIAIYHRALNAREVLELQDHMMGNPPTALTPLLLSDGSEVEPTIYVYPELGE